MTNAPNTTEVLRATCFENHHIKTMADTMCSSRNASKTGADDGDSGST